jgi:hypothetical protein
VKARPGFLGNPIFHKATITTTSCQIGITSDFHFTTPEQYFTIAGSECLRRQGFSLDLRLLRHSPTVIFNRFAAALLQIFRLLMM